MVFGFGVKFELRMETTKKDHWSLLLLKSTGESLGFRISVKTLERFSFIIGVLVLLLMLTFVSWLFARWEVYRLRDEISFLRMSQKDTPVAVIPVTPSQNLSANGASAMSSRDVAPPAMSQLPGLGSEDWSLDGLRVKNLNGTYFVSKKKLQVSFEVGQEKSDQAISKSFKYKWFVAFHGVWGALYFPSVVENQSALAFLVDRGESLELAKDSKKNIKAEFETGFQVPPGMSSPAFVSIYLFDERSNLVAKQRVGAIVGAE